MCGEEQKSEKGERSEEECFLWTWVEREGRETHTHTHTKKEAMGLAIVLVQLMIISIVVLVMSVEAQGTSSSCIGESSSLYTCFPYVKIGNDSVVGPECCKPLAAYVNAYPECLSTLRNLSLEIPNVNLSRANELNILCSITAPSPSNNVPTGMLPQSLFLSNVILNLNKTHDIPIPLFLLITMICLLIEDHNRSRIMLIINYSH